MSSAAIHHVTCPQEVRAQNRRLGLRNLYRSPEWKAAKTAYLKNHPVCDWCGKPAVLPHHVTDETYGTPEYLNLEAHCIPLCFMCHQKGRAGFAICPKCRKHYMASSAECCRYCIPVVEIEQRRIGREQKKEIERREARARRQKYNMRNRHSCGWHGRGQRCGNPLRRDHVCPHSAQNARARCDPDHFTERIAVAKKSAGVRA